MTPPSELSKRSERELLISAFQTVRNRYFPRCDKAQLCKCRINRKLVVDGLCCQATKTICINTKAENQVATLIHEICHALNPQLNHGGGWQQRMFKAASSAKRFGELSLAKFLRSE